MASIFDTIGADGIMRGILTEMLNGRPTALYPKTHSDSVIYKESSVEGALDELNRAHSNLSTLIKDTRSELKDFEESVYVKNTVNELLDAVYERLSSSFIEMTKLAIAIHGISTYNKEEVDQKFIDLEIPLVQSIQNLTQSYYQLSEYLTDNYDNRTTQEEKIAALSRKVEDFKLSISEIMNDLLRQFKAEIKDDELNTLSDYYKKTEIDSIVEQCENTFSTIRGDVALMNMNSAVDIKEHFNHSQDAILERNASIMKTECDNLEVKLNAKYAALGAKFDDIMSTLTALSNRVPETSEYQNADEVRF